MIDVKINGTGYQICTAWGDITIAQAAALLALKMPDSLYKVYLLAIRPGELTPEENNARIAQAEKEISLEDQHKTIPAYFLQVVNLLSNIPAPVLMQIDVNTIRTVYHLYSKRFVEGVHFFPADYKHENIASFDFQGHTYKLPTSKLVFGRETPMADLSALEFTESADLMIHISNMSADRDFSRTANIVSILCRPEGEPYNENVCIARAEQFKELPMNVCWNVFFSLIEPLHMYAQFIQLYSIVEQERANRAS
jgi:hypothetical protein